MPIRNWFYLRVRDLTSILGIFGKETQSFTHSWFNRYPTIFRAAQLYAHFHPVKRIMSFGCSHGEELKTLQSYFPNAQIIGVESNWLMNLICKFRIRRYRFKVFRSLAQIGDNQKFDAVFAMAVLQNTRDNGMEKQVFTFDKFNGWINRLNNFVAPGGLLAVISADFDFLDTEAAEYYQPLEYPEAPEKIHSQMYGKDSRLNPHKKTAYRIFIKNNAT